jgi:hypothetical protein
MDASSLLRPAAPEAVLIVCFKGKKALFFISQFFFYFSDLKGVTPPLCFLV